LLIYYLIITDYLYGFLNIAAFLFLLIFNLFNFLENYIIKNYFSCEEEINFINIQKKLKIDKVHSIFIQKNKNFNYIHKRHFSTFFTRELITKMATALGGTTTIAGAIVYGTDAYHKKKDRDLARKKMELEYNLAREKMEFEYNLAREKMEFEYKQEKEASLEEKQMALAELKDSFTLFSSKRHQEKVLEGQIHETKESLGCFDKIAKDNDIDVIPKALSVFEDFFF
jgi:hypothetical protein